MTCFKIHAIGVSLLLGITIHHPIVTSALWQGFAASMLPLIGTIRVLCVIQIDLCVLTIAFLYWLSLTRDIRWYLAFWTLWFPSTPSSYIYCSILYWYGCRSRLALLFPSIRICVRHIYYKSGHFPKCGQSLGAPPECTVIYVASRECDYVSSLSRWWAGAGCGGWWVSLATDDPQQRWSTSITT